MNRAVRVSLVLGLSLSASARAGFCQPQPFEAPIDRTFMPPPVYAGQPRDVQWTAEYRIPQGASAATTQVIWTARDYLKDGVVWKTVVYQGAVKGSHLYNATAGRWMGGHFRATGVPVFELFSKSSEQIRATLEARDAIEARKSLGETVRVEYDAQGRPFRYQGSAVPLAMESGQHMEVRISCEYLSDRQVVERMDVQPALDGGPPLVRQIGTYELDAQGRVMALGIQTTGYDGSAAPTLSMTYKYDPSALLINITSRTPAGLTRSEGVMDASGRPLSLTRRGEKAPYATWTYDAKGNWTEYRTQDAAGTYVVKRVITY